MIVANEKFVVQENELNGYKFQLVLVIKKLEKVVDQFCNNAMNITDNENGLYTRETLARTDVSARTPSGRLRRWWSSMVS